MYTLLYQLSSWLLVVSMHGKYRISDRVSKDDQIYLGPLSNDHSSMIISGYHWLQSQFVESISPFISIGTLRYPSWHCRMTSLSRSTMDCWRRTWRTDTHTRIVKWSYPSSNPLMSISFPHNHSTPTVSKASSIGSFGSTIILPRSASHTTW